MNWKKMFGAIAIPLALALAFNIITVLIYFFFLDPNSLWFVLSFAAFVTLLVIAWAGYKAAKNLQGNMVQAGIVGAAIALISAVVVSILMFELAMTLMLEEPSNTELTEVQRQAYSEMSPLGKFFDLPTMRYAFFESSFYWPLAICSIIVATALGFGLGLVGGAVANRKQKTASFRKN